MSTKKNYLVFKVKAKTTAATEKAPIPNRDTAYEPVALIRKPIKGTDKIAPREPQTFMTPNPMPALP